MSQLTRKAIVQSFIKLLNEMPLDKITVKDIVDDCGVNRGTFYYYYQDVYALLEEIFATETQVSLTAMNGYTDWLEGFLHSLSFVQENKKAIYHVYNSVDRVFLEKYLYRVVGDLMVQVVHGQTADLAPREEDVQIVAGLYTHALVGIMLDWLQNGMRDNLESKARRLDYLMADSIRQALARSNPRFDTASQ